MSYASMISSARSFLKPAILFDAWRSAWLEWYIDRGIGNGFDAEKPIDRNWNCRSSRSLINVAYVRKRRLSEMPTRRRSSWKIVRYDSDCCWP